MGVFSAQKVKVTSLHAKTNSQTLITLISASIHVANLERLNALFNAVLNIKGVINISRAIH